MTRFSADPLLGTARILLNFLMGVFALGLAGCAIALPALAIFSRKVLAEFAEIGAPSELVWLIGLVVVMAACLLALAFLFTRDLKRIVESVAISDPFVPENAKRLTAMAWLMLAIQVLAVPLIALGAYIGRLVEGVEKDIAITFNLSGLILVLTLFILARVFRVGAKMREDLEGTV